MASYDSDSSIEDDNHSGTSTNVLLGYATKDAVDDNISQLGGEPTWLSPDHPASGALAQCKCCNSHMALLLQLNGDLPDRFPGHERRIYVFACKRPACRRKPGSIRAVRGVRLSKSAKTKLAQASEPKKTPQPQPQPQAQTQHNIGASLFGAKPSTTSSTPSPNPNPFASANPFSSGGGSSTIPRANPFASPTSTLAAHASQTQTPISNSNSIPSSTDAAASPENLATLPATFAQKARISGPQPDKPTSTPPQTPWPPSTARPKPYPTYALDADYEYLSSNSTSAIPGNQAVFMDVDGTGPGSSAGGTGAGTDGKEDPLTYESTHDATFQHFADVLSQNPEQVLRYEFAGAPLLYSRSDAVGRLFASSPSSASGSSKVTTTNPHGAGIPKCAKCSAKRVFEVQLTPHAIVELEEGDESADSEGMEWGCVIVGVCERDCGGEDGVRGEYLEEWAGVQWEEVVGSRR